MMFTLIVIVIVICRLNVCNATDCTRIASECSVLRAFCAFLFFVSNFVFQISRRGSIHVFTIVYIFITIANSVGVLLVNCVLKKAIHSTTFHPQNNGIIQFDSIKFAFINKTTPHSTYTYLLCTFFRIVLIAILCELWIAWII